MDKYSFTRKEIAFLIAALTVVLYLDTETKKKCSMPDKRLNAMLFKLWRMLNSKPGIIC